MSPELIHNPGIFPIGQTISLNSARLGPDPCRSSMPPLLVLSSRQILLPDTDVPQPATLVINTLSGKIVNIRTGQESIDDLGPHLPPETEITWIDAGNKVVLPGLVECVLILWLRRY